MLSQHSQHCCQQCRAHTNFSAWYFQIIGSLSLSLSRSRTLLAHALTHALSLTQRTHATSGKVGGGHAWHTLTGVSFCTFERSLLRTNVPILTPAARTALPSTLPHTHIQTHTHTHAELRFLLHAPPAHFSYFHVLLRLQSAATSCRGCSES
jgi:hypothetical protein